MPAKIPKDVVVAHPFATVCQFFDMHRMPYIMPWNPSIMLATIDLHAKYYAQLLCLHNGLPQLPHELR